MGRATIKTDLMRIIPSIALALTIGVGTVALPVKGYAADEVTTMPRQAPGFYKWTLGNFAITSLSDGTFDLPVDQLLIGPEPGEVAAAFELAFAKLPMEMSVNAFLIDTGAQLILVDAGGGSLYGPTLGQTQQNLIAAGYQPDQVDLVLLTHIHGDHSGGLSIEGKPAYPNAKVWVGQGDIDFFTDPDKKEAAAGLDELNFSAAQSLLSAYQEAGQLVAFSGEREIVPGVRALPAIGHSTGHTVYAIESEGESLVLLGDLLHVPQVQFAHPEYSMVFDLDQDEAAAVRKTVLDGASGKRQWIAGAHFSFPGIGHLLAKGDGFTYVPAEYSANR